MQVRQVLIASVLAIGAAGAMSQEIDPGETLQARSLASRQDRAESSVATTRTTVAAPTRQADSSGQAAASELAVAVPVAAAPHISWAKWHVTRTYGKSWLSGDRRHARSVVVAEHA
jgi:hypothetical protein